MNERPTFLPKQWRRITAVLLVSVAAALIAIFVFTVAVDTAVTYGLLGLFLVSHLFMHAGHGGHGHDHAGHAVSTDSGQSVESKKTGEVSQ